MTEHIFGGKDFETYAQVEEAMNKLVKVEFDDKPFFKSLLNGELSQKQIRYFAIQYSFYSRHFPRVLGAAISAMNPLDTWWVPIADNLWDEAGRGAEGKSHEQLYKTFLNSVDADIPTDKNGVVAVPMSKAVEKAVTTFIEFFYRSTPLEAMAAVGLGSEMFAGSVMGLIGRGFEHERYQANGSINTLFWRAHADEHEPRHYQLCKDVLVSHTKPQELKRMYEVGNFIAKSEARMYDELYREMLEL
jgi:pyrroloquinoline-quinone synthase